MEKTSGDCGSQLVGVGGASDSDDHAISIRTVVSRELESIEEEDGDQTAGKQRQRNENEDEERRGLGAELAGPGQTVSTITPSSIHYFNPSIP